MTISEAKIYIPSEMLPWIDNDEFVPAIERNAMLLYPYIKNLTISHGKAANILGIWKNELIDIYARLGIPYYDFDEKELEDEAACSFKRSFSKGLYSESSISGIGYRSKISRGSRADKSSGLNSAAPDGVCTMMNGRQHSERSFFCITMRLLSESMVRYRS